MRFLGLLLLLVFLPMTFGFMSSQGTVRKGVKMYSHEKNISISVINVRNDNLEILEKQKKYAFIKLENISNSNFEDVFFRSISLLEERGALLFDLQKYQKSFLEIMIENHEIYDFSSMDLNENTFFWSKTFKFK
jgi:hypothetical protein